jgi:hypothetical protein
MWSLSLIGLSLADDDHRFNLEKIREQPRKYLEAGKPTKFSMSITTKVNKNLTWQHRSDHYKKMGNSNIHAA